MARAVGPYLLRSLLGQGGMGEVWSAVHGPTGREVAVKRLVGGPSDGRAREALRRELRAIAALDHPGVLVVHDAGEDGGVPFVVTELGDADLARARPVTWGEVRDVLAQVLRALAHAHARGLLHRDLKPENVLRVGGRWKLADFGLAWDTAVGEGGPVRAGSPAFMAPEQIRGEAHALGPWTDLYALGCIGWELVAGVSPFARTTVEAVARAQLQEPLPQASGWSAPPGYRGWLGRLLAKRPEDRFRAAPDALHALLGLPDLDAVIAPEVRTTTLTWATLLDLDVAPPASPLDEEPPAPVLAPPLPARWREEREEPVPRHGAEMALVGLRTPRLVGREAERERAWAALAEVAATRAPRLLVVEGEVGLGRTRLLAWVGEQVAECGAAEVAWRLGLRRTPLPRTLEALAADRPWVVILDDADQDPEPVAFVEWVATAAAIGPAPVLVVASVRDPTALPPDGPLGAEAVRLPLAPLAPVEIEALARQVLRLDELALLDLARRSEGNPRFAVEVLRHQVRAGRVVADAHGYRLPVGAALEVPGSLVELGARHVEARLADAPPGAREALELLATLEPPVARATWEGLCAAAGVDVEAALSAAGELLELTEGRVGLSTPMARDHLEATARAAGRWVRWNDLAAERLTDLAPSSRGRHLAEAGRDREALPVLLSAVERGRSVLEPTTAVRLRAEVLRRLGVPEDDVEWARQWAGVAMTAVLRGDLRAAREAASRALPVARALKAPDAVSLACRALTLVARLESVSALPWVREGLAAEAELGTERPSRMSLFHELLDAGRIGEALALVDELEAERLPRLQRRGILDRMRARALLARGELAAAALAADRAVAIDEAAGSTLSAAYDHHERCRIALEAGDLDAAARHAAAAHEHHQRTGALLGYLQHFADLANLRLARGDLEGAEAAATTVMALTRALGQRGPDPELLLARIDLARGRRAAARARVAPLLDALPADAPIGVRAELLGVLARAGDEDRERWAGWLERLAVLVDGGYRLPSVVKALEEGRALAGVPEGQPPSSGDPGHPPAGQA